MPTSRGWLVLTAGLLLWLTSSALGVAPLSQLGFGLAALVVISVIVVRTGKHEVVITRSVNPERVQAGREVTVTLTLANEGRGSAPLLLLEDSIPSELSGRARFAIRGIEAKGHRLATYQVRPARRGLYALGPSAVTVMDPFGVARTERTATQATTFVAYPRTEPLVLPKDSGVKRAMMTSARRNPTGSQGEDFYTLREYVEGDDLRRIHWPATAKRNRYMIRQEETPWHARATVLLDDRVGIHSVNSWERSIEAAASVLDLYSRSGYAFRLVQSVGMGVRSGRGADQLNRCLDLLATVEQQSSDRTDVDPMTLKLAELEGQSTVEGILIAVTDTPTLEIAHALTRCSRRFRLVVSIVVPGHRYSFDRRSALEADRALTATRPLLERGGVKTLVLGPGDALSTSWAALWNTWAPVGAVQGAEVTSGGV